MESILQVLQKNKVILLLTCLFLMLFILSLLSMGTYGGPDDYSHFRIARYAFKYPHLLLDHWGKPTFTLLASPFAQFGFAGIVTFNMLIGLAAAYLTYRTCKELNISIPELSIIYVCFAPVYFSLLLSGMTEILFSFVLILGVFLAIKKKYLLSSLIISFLPFVRNEGIVIIPLFATFYFLRRNYVAIPALLTGFCIYSIAGSFYYNDIFWVITKIPYTGAKDIYGSGELLHFITSSRSTMGIPLTILWIIGAFMLLKEYLWKSASNTNIHKPFVHEWFLITGSFFAYLVFHSVAWWMGWFSSLGLTRVLAGVVPVFVILSVKATAEVFTIIKPFKKTKYLFLLGILYLVISTPFKIYKFPVPLGKEEKIIREAVHWIHENGLDRNRVYYYNPYYCFYSETDPFDISKCWEGVHDRQQPSRDIKEGSIIIWDAHFGPNEGGLPLERIMKDSLMQLLKVFQPFIPFEALGKINYEVCIFKKMKTPSDPNFNVLKYSEYKIEPPLMVIDSLDFENPTSEINGFTIVDTFAYQGRKSCYLTEGNEFGPAFRINLQNFMTEEQQVFETEIYYFNEANLVLNELILVASIEHKGKLYFYKAEKLENCTNYNVWVKQTMKFIFPEIKGKADIFKAYLWNPKKQSVFIDNFKIKFREHVH